MSANREKYWREGQEIYEELRDEDIGVYLSKTNKWVGQRKKAFEEDVLICCVDEGVVKKGGVHYAGSGMYLDMYGKKMSVTPKGIWTHEGCGAAMRYCERHGLGTDPVTVEKFAQQWGEDLAKKLGVPYLGHIGVDELNRPAHMHTARVTYYDGTGRFNYEKLKKMPPGFTISRKYHDKEYAKEELALTLGIAFGDHGFGDMFTEENPYILCLIGNPDNGEFSFDNLEEEAETILTKNKTLRKYYEDGRVIIKGFTAPG